jgi:hypothetical protein
LALGFLSPVRADDKKPAAFTQGTQVVVVGRITSPPKGELNEHKMQVAIGPEKKDYTLHFRKAEVLGLHGQKLDEDGLDDGQWVRAEGRVMDDPRRIEVTRVQVIAPDDKEHKRSAFYRPGYDFGYISTVAGIRQVFPQAAINQVSMGAPFVLVGRVSDDTGPFEGTRKLQVTSAGNTWTLNVPKDTPVLDVAGKKISVHEIHDKQWVRAYGWRSDDLRMRVERLENIGRDEAFRAAAFYRADSPLGYVEPLEGNNRFTPVTLSGTVVSTDPVWGSVTIRDDNNQERVLYGDAFRFLSGGTGVTFEQLRPGDKVSVEGRTIRFE